MQRIRSCILSAACHFPTANPCSARSSPRSGRICCACPTARPASARPGSGFCSECSPTTRRSRSQPTCRRSSSRNGTASCVREIPRLRLRAGAKPDPATFVTGYADMAIASWGLFDRLQKAGAIPPRVKFQVSLPTPIAPTYNNMVPSDRAPLLPALAEHLIGEVAKIAAAVPNDRLATPMGRVPGGAGLGGLLRARVRSISASRPSTC